MEIPRIQFNLHDHRVSIAITWTILFISSGALPVVLYFALRYGAHLALPTVLGITTAIFGVVSLISLLKRSYDLLKSSSTCRPICGSRWSMDYFNWSFMVCFVGITAIIVAGNVLANVRVVALGLSILLLFVCGQLLVAAILVSRQVPAPFTVSSVRKGQPLRSGVYTITEDVVAVDGGEGLKFRKQLDARYRASNQVQNMCHRLDIIWGTSGFAFGATTIALIFGLRNENVAYTFGWMIPWAYAVVMAIITIRVVQVGLKKEQLEHASGVSALSTMPREGDTSPAAGGTDL